MTRHVVLVLLLVMAAAAAAHAYLRECGENPMTSVNRLASGSGKTLMRVLTLMRTLDEKTYASLARRIQEYAACIGVVDTGYFRKRSADVSCDVDRGFLLDMCFLLDSGPDPDSLESITNYVALRHLCEQCHMIGRERLDADRL